MMDPIAIHGLPPELASTVRPHRDKHESQPDTRGKNAAKRDESTDADDGSEIEGEERKAPPRDPDEIVGNIIDVEG